MIGHKVEYLPAIGIVDGPNGPKADYFWSDDPRPLETIDTILIHSMFSPNEEGEAKYSAEACRNLLNSLGVSAHYFIDRLGKIFQSVDEVRQAWQAGKSKMPFPDERTGVNKFGIGIELIGNEQEGFTPEQYDSVAWLAGQIMGRLDIKNILGHSDVSTAEIRPDPKTDPGKNFNWEAFFSALAQEVEAEKLRALKLLGGQTNSSKKVE